MAGTGRCAGALSPGVAAAMSGEITKSSAAVRAAPGAEGDFATVDPRTITPARIGLRRVGVSLATRHVLELSEAHALARDAVHASLPVARMLAAVNERGLPGCAVKSAASDRAEYLRRPDLGRRLAADSERMLRNHAAGGKYVTRGYGTPIAVVIGDGLSALAVERHALPLLDALLPQFGLAPDTGGHDASWSLAVVVIGEQARVALGDSVAEAVGAELVIVLIGERPGLSSPDSLGAYITWRPRVGCTDAERNCVSNIRADGLGYSEAAARISWYCTEGRRAGASGVELLSAAARRALDGGPFRGSRTLYTGEAREHGN